MPRRVRDAFIGSRLEVGVLEEVQEPLLGHVVFLRGRLDVFRCDSQVALISVLMRLACSRRGS